MRAYCVVIQWVYMAARICVSLYQSVNIIELMKCGVYDLLNCRNVTRITHYTFDS